MSAQKTRVMLILQDYPQVSQTYIKTEIEAVEDAYELKIIAIHQGLNQYRASRPYEHTGSPQIIAQRIAEFRPHVLHSHWLNMAVLLSRLAWETDTPFTIRAHSFDTAQPMHSGTLPEHLTGMVRAVNDSMCLGVLTFPYTRPHLEKIGIQFRKLIDCWPVMAYDRFYDPTPNGRGVMNMGARSRKKRMQDFVDLAPIVPDRSCDLYLVDSVHDDNVVEYNQQKGSPVRIHESIDPDDMKAVYKAHDWLVYTADRQINSVGWPVSVSEAQAAGLGVCVPGIRPDMREYVGPAGFVYDSIEQVAQIISRPYPAQMRQAGFEHAKRSDIQRHKHLLTDIWNRARRRPRRVRSLIGRVLGKIKGMVGQ